MHRLIAAAFSRALAIIHIFVIAGFVLAAVGGLGSGDATIAFVYVPIAFVGYVLFAGFASTVIRINQNLERLAEATEPQREIGSKEPIRKEPVLRGPNT